MIGRVGWLFSGVLLCRAWLVWSRELLANTTPTRPDDRTANGKELEA